MRPGEDLETLTETIFQVLTSGTPGLTTVRRNVQLPGPDGPRQIDVLVRATVGPFELTTVIECKDTCRKVPVTVVDELHSKIQDVGANKGAVVTRNGFSRTARLKADRLGVDLFLADQLSNVQQSVIEVPVHVRELRQVGLASQSAFRVDTAPVEFDKDAIFHANDRNIAEMLRAELLQDPTISERTRGRHTWRPDPPDEGWYIRDVEGQEYALQGFEISYELQETHFFGYLAELEKVMYLYDVTHDQARVLVPAEALFIDYAARFASFDDPAKLPVAPLLTVSAVVLPDPADAAQTFADLRWAGP